MSVSLKQHWNQNKLDEIHKLSSIPLFATHETEHLCYNTVYISTGLDGYLHLNNDEWK